MKVHVINRKLFGETINTFIHDDRYAFISINSPEFPQFFPDSKNYLNLTFDDVDEEYQLLNGDVTISFNEQMARQVLEFVKSNSDKTFIVHCLMGINRSGSIGKFISDFIGQPYEIFKQTNPQVIGNNTVTKHLNKILYEDTIGNEKNSI